MNHPPSRSKRTIRPAVRTVLVAVTGKASPILTEALWHLAGAGELPDDLVVVTTEDGKKEILDCLFTPQDSTGQFPNETVWDALMKEVRRFTQEEPHRDLCNWGPDNPAKLVVAGTPDVRTETRAQTFADQLFKALEVRKRQSPPWRVIALLGGARKQMECLLYGCMTLLGTEDDKIVTVMVTPEKWAAAKPRFYFPPAKPTLHHIDNRPPSVGSTAEPLSTNTAKIALVNVPFPIESEPHSTATERVARARSRFKKHFAGYDPEISEVRAVTVHINDRELRIQVGGKPPPPAKHIKLSAMELAVYLFLVARTKARPGEVHLPQRELTQELDLWLRATPKDYRLSNLRAAENWISRTLYQLKKKLRDANLQSVTDQIVSTGHGKTSIPSPEMVAGIPEELISISRPQK